MTTLPAGEFDLEGPVMIDPSGIPPHELPRGKLDFYKEDLPFETDVDPRARIRRPAIALLAVTLISQFLVALGCLAAAWYWITMEDAEAGMAALGMLFLSGLHLVTLVGLISAITLRNYVWAWLGVGLSVLPCSNLLAMTWLPLMISAWAVFGLLAPETRKQFRK